VCGHLSTEDLKMPRTISLLEMMLIVAVVAVSIPLAAYCYSHANYRTAEVIHDLAGDLWYGPTKFQPMQPANEQQRLRTESERASVKIAAEIE
jgi:hypothetical protein